MAPASVPLPQPTRGDLLFSFGNRRWIIPENRSHTKTNPETLIYNPIQQDPNSLASIKDRLGYTTRVIGSLKIRIAFLRVILERERARSLVFLLSKDERKEPPDPGRAQSTEAGTN